jgi:hypothetical protein
MGTSHSQTDNQIPSFGHSHTDGQTPLVAHWDRRPDSFSHGQADKQTPLVKQTPRSEHRRYLYTAARGRPSAHQHRR